MMWVLVEPGCAGVADVFARVSLSTYVLDMRCGQWTRASKSRGGIEIGSAYKRCTKCSAAVSSSH